MINASSTGLITDGKVYINPNSIRAFEENKLFGTRVYMADNHTKDFDCTNRKFANAVIEAQNTGEIVSIYA